LNRLIFDIGKVRGVEFQHSAHPNLIREKAPVRRRVAGSCAPASTNASNEWFLIVRGNRNREQRRNTPHSPPGLLPGSLKCLIRFRCLLAEDGVNHRSITAELIDFMPFFVEPRSIRAFQASPVQSWRSVARGQDDPTSPAVCSKPHSIISAMDSRKNGRGQVQCIQQGDDVFCELLNTVRARRGEDCPWPLVS